VDAVKHASYVSQGVHVVFQKDEKEKKREWKGVEEFDPIKKSCLHAGTTLFME